MRSPLATLGHGCISAGLDHCTSPRTPSPFSARNQANSSRLPCRPNGRLLAGQCRALPLAQAFRRGRKAKPIARHGLFGRRTLFVDSYGRSFWSRTGQCLICPLHRLLRDIGLRSCVVGLGERRDARRRGMKAAMTIRDIARVGLTRIVGLVLTLSCSLTALIWMSR